MRGRLLYAQGDAAASLADLRRARDVATVREDSEGLARERTLIDMFESSTLVATQAWREAEASDRRALQGARGLAELHPDLAYEQRLLMNALVFLSDVQRKRPIPNLDEAANLLHEAAKIAEGHAAADRSNVQAQLDLTLMNGRLGQLAARRHDWSGSLAAFQRSRTGVAPLRRNQPNHTLAMEHEAFALEGIGEALAALGRTPEALAAYEGSHALSQRLATLDQRVDALRSVPALGARMGRLYAKSGQRALAAQHLRRSVADWEEVRVKHPAAYAAGEAAQAAKDLRELGTPKQ